VIETEYKWIVLTVTTVGAFMAAVDSTVLIVGLPTVLIDLNATLVHGIWILTGYRLAVTILLVAIGRVADMLGRVRLYNSGFAIFTASSVLCAISRSGDQLVFFRLIQGIGGALLIVNSVAIIADAFPTKELGTGIGVNFMAFNLGSIVGYTVSGIMIELLGWRSIFLINVPIGIFGTLWSYARLKEMHRGAAEKFDFAGAILYSSALTLILLGLSLESPSSPTGLALLTSGLLLFPVFVAVERRVTHPTIDLDLFKTRQFSAGNLASFLNSVAFNSLPFVATLYFQLIRQLDAVTTGLLFIPMEMAVFIIGPLSGKLSDRYGARGLCTLGLVFNVATLLWLSTADQNTDYTVVTLGLIVAGVGRGLFMSPNASSIMIPVPPDKRGVGNGIRTTVVQTAVVVSLPLSLAFMTLAMPYSQISELTGGTSNLLIEESLSLLSALHVALRMSAILVLSAVIPSLLRGARMTKPDAEKLSMQIDLER